MRLQAPFPYFGGKASIAHKVWQYLGQPDHYLEPFFGSGAVLLARPRWTPDMTESVCDKDGFIANVWRSIQFAPDEVAKWCDWPVNHADLMARKAELIRNEQRLLENLVTDPMWHDPVLAGYWIWAASCWIGSGLTDPGSRPHLGNKGMGVHKASMSGQIPQLTNKGVGVHKASMSASGIYEWFAQLSTRLRRVRVVCGDFKRVLGGDWQDKGWSDAGIFFDPPYGDTDRAVGVYHHDSTSVSHEVEAWCLERGSRKNYRIVIAGYGTEYQQLIEAGWTTESWSAGGGYGNVARSGITRGQENRHRETLFVSPYCNVVAKQMELFE